MSPSTVIRDQRQHAAEIKFLIPPTLVDPIRSWARSRLAADPHGAGADGDSYRITSLYFDDADWDVFHRRGSFGRAKFRIRRYGGDTRCFLERKLRNRRLLTKRRSGVALTELERLADGGTDGDWPGRWFARRVALRRIRPVVQIGYRRTARVMMTPRGPVRLTLDEDLRALPACGFAFAGEPGRPILPGRVVLELKFMVQMPVLFKDLVAEFCLQPQRFSKYRHAAVALGLAEAPQPRALSTPNLVFSHA